MPRKRRKKNVRMGIDDEMDVSYEYPPAFYAQKIYDKCIRKNMLIYDGRVWRVVQEEIKRDILNAIRYIFFETLSERLERGRVDVRYVLSYNVRGFLLTNINNALVRLTRVGLDKIFIEENRRFVSMVDIIISVFSEGLEGMLRDERYGRQDLRTVQRRLF